MQRGQRGQEVETCKLEGLKGPVSNPFLPIQAAAMSGVTASEEGAEVRPLRKLNTSKWRVLLHSLDPSSLLRPLQKRWSRKCKIRLGPLTNSRSRCPAMWNRRTVKTCQDGSTIRLLQIRLSLSMCCFTLLCLDAI